MGALTDSVQERTFRKSSGTSTDVGPPPGAQQTRTKACAPCWGGRVCPPLGGGADYLVATIPPGPKLLQSTFGGSIPPGPKLLQSPLEGWADKESTMGNTPASTQDWAMDMSYPRKWDKAFWSHRLNSNIAQEKNMINGASTCTLGSGGRVRSE